MKIKVTFNNILNRNGQENAIKELVIKGKTLTGEELENKFNGQFYKSIFPC